MPINGEEMTLLEKTMQLIEKYGIRKILKAILIIGFFLYIIYNVNNFNTFIEKVINKSIDNAVQTELIAYGEKQKEEHDEAMEYRKIANEQIPKIIDDIMIRTNCDRVFIMEVHNGTKSISGLPFTYGNVTYEKDNTNIMAIADDYNNIVLSRFPFLLYIEENKTWSGTMDELMQLDKNLAMRLKSNNANYLFLVRLQGKSEMLGYLGITYCNHIPSDNQFINQELLIDAQSIVSLLDVE